MPRVNTRCFAVRRLTSVVELDVVVDKLKAIRASGYHDLGLEVK